MISCHRKVALGHKADPHAGVVTIEGDPLAGATVAQTAEVMNTRGFHAAVASTTARHVGVIMEDITGGIMGDPQMVWGARQDEEDFAEAVSGGVGGSEGAAEADFMALLGDTGKKDLRNGFNLPELF